MSVAPMYAPDRGEVRAHLDALFARATEVYPDGLIELRYGPPTDLTHWRYFSVSEKGREQAAQFACSQNGQAQNVYVGVNPRKGSTPTNRAGATGDVEIALFHFADIDRADAAEKLKDRVSVAPNLLVMTGTVPNNRPHLYWSLETPEYDLEAWTNRQRQIANSLDGDMVIDPPRIMRLGGTVNYPTQAKLGRGYKVEITEVRRRWSEERPPVDSAALIASLPQVAVVDRGAKGAAMYDFGPGKTDRLIRAALSDENWHNHVRNLVARLARQGRTDGEILLMAAGLTRPGFTVADTTEELRKYLISARVKFGIAQPIDDDEREDAQDDAPIFELLDIDQLEALPPPTWLVHELVSDHGLSIIYGAPGGGKTFIALDMALRIAHGMDWHGQAVKQSGVLYIAGEGARGIGKRIKGWRREHALEGAEAPFLALPAPVQMLDPDDRRKLLRTIEAGIARMGTTVGLVIIDTVSRSLAGQDENGQEAMTLFVNACNQVQEYIGGAVLGVHHSGKDASRGMRGSTVLLGGCDASIRLTRDEDGRVAIEVEKQKDAEAGDPRMMTLKKVIWDGEHGEMSTLVPFLSSEPAAVNRSLSINEVRQIFKMVQEDYDKGVPWGITHHSKRRGRYLAGYIAENFGIDEPRARGYVEDWQQNNMLRESDPGIKGRAKGLEVLEWV